MYIYMYGVNDKILTIKLLEGRLEKQKNNQVFRYFKIKAQTVHVSYKAV